MENMSAKAEKIVSERNDTFKEPIENLYHPVDFNLINNKKESNL